MAQVTTHPPQDAAGSTDVEIVPVRSRAERDAFVRFPWTIYRDDPAWAPPLLMERKEFIDPRRHPFYRHGVAQQFLALRQGRVVGTIQASDDPHYNREHASNAGCFGLFETIDDSAVAHAMLQTAADWLLRRGRTQLLGPIDYSTNYHCGLLIDGFSTPPRVMMNHQRPYYRPLLESWGLTKAKDLYSWWFTDQLDLRTRWKGFAARMARRGRVVIRPFNLRNARADLASFKEVYNQSWRQNWGFVPMADAEFDDFARNLIRWVPPELALLAEVEGRVVGLAMTLPDVNEATRPLNGRLFRWGLPLGYWALQRNLRRVRTGRLVALGVLEEFRRRGVAELLILQTLINGTERHNFEQAELGWTLEDNLLINKAIESVGAQRYKTYRIYQKQLDD